MKESKFVDQKKQQWTEFEEENRKKVKNPKLLSKYFIQITDDLSYARTFYRNRLVRVYLNGAAQYIFYGIYKNERNSLSKFVQFWKEDLPLSVYHSRKAFRISFLVFFLSFLIGFISSAYDNDFPKLILGQKYIEETLKNIENGNPMAIYKQEIPAEMFLAITFNNLRVAFQTFVFGILMALGTLLIMLYNGIMVGTFQYFFVERGLFWESFLTIWQHGTLEISSIIIAGAAGLTMGKGLVFPETLSRYLSFKISARYGLKLMAGIVPIIIFAAFIESFFTRYTDAPDWVRILVILASLSFILIYFVWYPKQKAKNTNTNHSENDILSAADQTTIKNNVSYSNQELTSNTFIFLRTQFGRIAKAVLLSGFVSSLFICVLFYFIYNEEFEDQINYINIPIDYFNYEIQPYFFYINAILFSIVSYLSLIWVSKQMGKINKKSLLSVFKNVFSCIFAGVLLNIGFFINIYIGLIFLVIAFPFLEFALYNSYHENTNYFKGFVNSFSVMQKSWGKFIGLYFKLSLFGFAILFLISINFIWQFMEIIFWNVYLREDFYFIFNFFIRTFIIISVVLFVLSLIKTGIYLFYYTAIEASTAQNLIERINQIGKKKRIFGYEIENHINTN